MFKRLIFQIVMLFVITGSVWAATPALDLGTTSGAVGTTVTVPMTFTANGAAVVGVSMDIGYDPAALTTPTATLAPAMVTAGFSLGKSTPSSGIYRLLISNSSGNVNVIDGVVANVTFTVAKTGTTTLVNTPDAVDVNSDPVVITGANGSVTGLGLSQTISFGAAPSLSFGGSAGTLSATASSGLAVSFSSTTTGVCTVSGNTVTPVAAGTCTIAANQAGNSTYSAAAQVTQTITVAQASQTLSFGTAPVLTFGGSTGTVSATATSGLTPTYTSSTTGVCTVSGSTVTPVAAGTCTIVANQAGNANYSAAAPVSQNITVAKADQTLSFGAAPALTFGGSTGTVSATATSGLAPTYGSSTTGVCTVSGSTVTPVAAGTCTIVANQAGNANYNVAAPVSQSFTVAQANQSISFGAAPTLSFGGPNGTLSATATSGLAVSFSSTTTGVCTVSGSTVTPVAAGSCIIAANQAGNSNYNAAAQQTQTITVGAASQTISFGAAPTLSFGGSNGTLSATATSGLAVTFSSTTTGVCTVSGNTVTPVAAGTCIVAANQAGNSNVNAATQVTQSIPVAQASQTLSFGTAPVLTFAGSTGTVSATATSGLTPTYSSSTTGVCTVSGSTVTPVAAGTCTIVASQAGNANYSAATPVSQSFTVAQASQTISFGAAPTLTVGGGTGTVSATATSNLAVSFSSSTTGICTISGSTVTPVAAGTCTIVANQSGNANYSAAAAVPQSFTIGKGSQTVSFGAAPGVVVGSTGTVTATGGASTSAVLFSSTTTSVCTVSGNVVTGVTAGTCIVAANQAADANYNAAAQATQSITIGKGSQTLTFGTVPTITFGGTGTLTATGGASTSPIVLSSTTASVCSVSGTTVTALAAGTCTIAANRAGDANYNAAAQVTQNISIGKAAQTIVFGTAPASVVVGTTGTVTVTPGASTSALALTSSTPTVCSISNSTVTGITAGTCTIAANQAADANYNAAAQVTQSFSIGKANQTISFGAAPSLVVRGTGALSATGGASTSAVAFSSTTPAVCTVSGSTVTGVTVGTCIVAANQAADANYNAASQVTLSITVGKGSQVITFGQAPNVVVNGTGTLQATGGTSTSPVVFTSNTASVCTVSGSTVTGVAEGTCTIAANQAADANYNAASQQTQSFTVTLLSVSVGTPSAAIVKTGDSVTFPITYNGADSVSLVAANVSLNVSGNATGSIAVTGTGTATRTVTVSNLTGNGTIGITINAGTATSGTNTAGASAPSATFIVDNAAPTLVVNTLANNTITSNNTLGIQGTVTDANAVQSLTVNGTDITAQITNGSFTYADTLQVGANTVTVVATDSVGNSTSNTRTVFYDHTAPVISFSAPTPANQSVTAVESATISGSINKPGTVTVTVNGNTPIAATMNGTSFLAPITLALGANTIVVTAADTAVADNGAPAPNTSTEQRTVTFDNTKPAVAIIDPAQAITTTMANYLVKGTVDDLYTPVTLDFKVDGVSVTPPVVTNGTFEQNVALSVGKTYTISVRATDEAGNFSDATQSIVYRPLSITDAVRALQIAVGLAQPTTQDDVLDVAPVINGVPTPNGTINAADVSVILRKVTGQLSW